MTQAYALIDPHGAQRATSGAFDPEKAFRRVSLSDGSTLLIQDGLQDVQDEIAALKRQLEEAIHENAAKESFLSSMSHDLRTPMNAIVGLTALAKNHIDEKTRVMDSLNKIETASSHLLNLINDVLDVSRINSGRLTLNDERFTLSDLFHEVLTIVRPQIEQRGHSWSFTADHIEDEALSGDTLRLRQIYVNIINNAVKYTPAGGRIELGIRQRREGESSLLIFFCRDNGVGMTPEFLKKIFDPFERVNSQENAHIEGTGLGMSIVKRLIEAMKGHISIVSAPGEGTEVTIEIPLRIEPLQLENAALKGRRLLAIEANDASAARLKDYLQAGEVRLDVVADGEQALDTLTDASVSGDDIEAVIIGSMLNSAASPFDMARYLHKFHPELPLIWVSDADWTKNEYQAQRSGISAFIPQPIFRVTLLNGINRALSADAGAPTVAAYPDLTHKTLLLVDDNMINREIAKEILSVTHATVDTAENGEQAVKAYLESSTPYALILMDIQMPVMDGYEAARRIRASGRPDAATIPIIAMTANTFAEDVQRARDAGMNGHLGKPVSVEALMQQLRSVAL